MPMRFARFAVLALPLCAGACVSTTDQTGSIGAGSQGAVAQENARIAVGPRIQTGAASWYGPGFGGRRTASGESFQPSAFTAAHRSLLFGTRLRVVHLGTGRSVVVRVNDRGPFSRGRVIDLSQGAARAIGLSGVGRVSLHQVD